MPLSKLGAPSKAQRPAPVGIPLALSVAKLPLRIPTVTIVASGCSCMGRNFWVVRAMDCNRVA